MRGINILNKQGMLTEEDRKQPLEHGCNRFAFKTCIDLSEPIQVIPYGTSKKHSLQHYSQDVSAFMLFILCLVGLYQVMFWIFVIYWLLCDD